MKNIIFRIAGMLIFAILLSSCGSSRAHLSDKNEPQPKKPSTSKKVITAAPPQVKLNTASPEALPEDNREYNITSFARHFEGTPYKYGGTTRDGMDCSGLVYCSFKQENIPVPRSSREMAKEGERLSLEEVN